MQNIPNSAPQISAKKRKLSSTSSASSRNLDRPTQATRKSSRNQQADVGSGDHVKNLQNAVDEKILNSEIYKIYCQNEDPKEAIKQIRELKTCIYFEQSTQPALAEDDLKRESEYTLNTLWKLKPLDSKFITIKKYVGGQHAYTMHSLTDKMYNAFTRPKCFTEIKMLLPNGYEFWYVSNIEGGHGLSKWYRAESTSRFGVKLLAQLNVMGITESVIQKLQNNLEREARKIQWSDFAFGVLHGNVLRSLFPSYINPRCAFEFVEAKTKTTKVVNATLRLSHGLSGAWETFKTYHGESTRPLKKAGRPNEEIEEMKKEAKKAALMEFFKERFGFTEFKDLYVDELQRSIGN